MDNSDVVDHVRRRGVPASQIPGMDVLGLITDTLREWSNVRGPLAVSTLTTVADQYTYAVPSDTHKVIGVYWAPGLEDETVQNFLDEMQTSTPLDPHYPSLGVMRDIDTHRWRKTFTGTYQVEGDTIYLFPTPDNAYRVPLVYRTLAEISDITSGEEALFLDGVYAFCIERRGQDMFSTAGWRASRVTVDGRVGDRMLTRADRLLNEWRHRLGAGKVATGQRS